MRADGTGPASAGIARPGRDRLTAALSLAAVAALAWLYLWVDAKGMSAGWSPSGWLMAASMENPWSPLSLALAVLMWSMMMVGMMLPSAMPAILLYGRLVAKQPQGAGPLPAVWAFAGGYLAVWTGFSLAAALAEAALQSRDLLTPMLESTSRPLTGGLLIAAGVYQWLPIKHICLTRCRAPLSYLLMNWRPGRRGAFRLGAGHGVFCVGCCWVLMLLLFAAGRDGPALGRRHRRLRPGREAGALRPALQLRKRRGAGGGRGGGDRGVKVEAPQRRAPS